LWIIVGLAIPAIATLMPDFRARYGPSIEHFKTGGIFQPGGFIHFDVDTGVNSIQSDSQYSYDITPQLDQNLVQKGASWDSVHGEGGAAWGDTISCTNTCTVGNVPVIPIDVDIPNEEALTGANISVDVTINLLTPEPTNPPSGEFWNKNTQISGTLSFVLTEEFGQRITPLGAYDLFAICPLASARCFSFQDRAAILSWYIGLPAAVFLASYVMGRRRRKTTTKNAVGRSARNQSGFTPSFS
jgi:hypothetical protein